MIDPAASRREDEDSALDAPRWRIPDGQRFVFAEFEDGIVMFDARVGSTHLVNATAAEALAIVRQTPGLTAEAIHRMLLARMGLDEAALPRDALTELLWQLENLGLVAVAGG